MRELFNGYAIAKSSPGALMTRSAVFVRFSISKTKEAVLCHGYGKGSLLSFGDSAGEKRGRQVIWNRAGRTYRWPGAWAYGKGVILGIIDSGIDYLHPDFRNETAVPGFVSVGSGSGTGL